MVDDRWDGTNGIGRFSREILKRLRGFERISIKGRPSSPVDPFRLASHLRKTRAEFFFSPGYNAPWGCDCPFGFTIHDLNHLFVEQNSTVLKSLYYTRILKPAARKARVVFTVSNFSRYQLVEWSGVNEDRVVVISPGISPEFTPCGDVYRSERPYLLYVGNDRPHKNLGRMLAGFSKLRSQNEMNFVITGQIRKDTRKLIERLNIRESVKCLGGVSEVTLGLLYRGAMAVLFVSTYEGFGLPIVEAMACGTPVITGTVASMPEVAGDAALLVDPWNVEEIAAAIFRATHDNALRNALVAKGLQRARLFNWDNAAVTMQTVLDVAMNS